MDSENHLQVRTFQDEVRDHVSVTVTLNGTVTHIRWNTQMALLDALLDAGIQVPYSCCRGNCATCVCKLEKGEVRIGRNFVLSETHIRQGLILTCTTSPVSERIEINYDSL